MSGSAERMDAAEPGVGSASGAGAAPGSIPDAVVLGAGARDTVAAPHAAGASRTTETVASGTVWLVGAGPGDAGLLTLRGLRALESADVIVADRLGARGVLDGLAAEGVHLDAEVIDVGKLPGHHAVPQDAINALLVREALAGRTVVRLKGGDPYVFGRGGEELFACQEAGIDVRVVPGVTSAVSVPALAGIPLTHRGVATSFTVATAHDQIAALGGGRDHTVVLLMGVGTLAHSALTLARGERGADCPVAIVEDGFGARQRVTVGTLATIAAQAAERGVRSPAVVVVGDVVRLSPYAPAALASIDLTFDPLAVPRKAPSL
ncbi:uroporphyrinogen-III C-methyltransferase [Microbacterium sp. lyk4-40-TSB-66]|uniref:uroporphyrinogen-III C-methyltransferase n=1 Tax=Microbacterium sp. lyk4-40-TSB-66 TaxID=3040294 RepID=UPI0033061BA4